MSIIDHFRFSSEDLDKLKQTEHYGKRIGENWPVVYILNNSEEAYVGETHHASVRMSQHLNTPAKQSMEQVSLITDSRFNKSVILDLEAFLIKHMGSDGKFRLQNGNHGLQDHDYYERSTYEDSFLKIWSKLRQCGIADWTISEIENSNLYKYSPYKTLGAEQMEAEKQILQTFAEYKAKDGGVSIVVNGGAGTGKTILGIYLMKLFADINAQSEDVMDPLDFLDEDVESIVAADSLVGINKIGIVMPQSTLQKSIQDVFGSIRGLDKRMVLSPADVVKDYVKTGEKFDLLIVDESHRLKCRWKGHLSSYKIFDDCCSDLGIDKAKGSELEWIMKCSDNQIFFRDELQTVRPCDLDSREFSEIIGRYHDTEISIPLTTQWRCEGGNGYIDYVKNILGCRPQKRRSFDNYDFKLYRDVDRMVNRIKELDAKYGLCRNAAGYAWKWVSKGKDNRDRFDIEIGDYQYRWNTEYKNWINTPDSINEIGCIHTLQGYDLNYVGLIIGRDIYYDEESGTIKADKDNYHDQQGKSGVANDPAALLEYLTNIYLTLMTRGIKGTYLYICDDALRGYFEQYVEYAD